MNLETYSQAIKLIEAMPSSTDLEVRQRQVLRHGLDSAYYLSLAKSSQGEAKALLSRGTPPTFLEEGITEEAILKHLGINKQ